MLLQDLLDDGSVQKPTMIHEDNMGAIFIATNRVLGARTKHIDVRYHLVKDAIENGDIEVPFVRSKMNRADGLTKNLPQMEFETGRSYWLGEQDKE